MKWGGFEEVTKRGGVLGDVGQVLHDPVVELKGILVTDVGKFCPFELAPEVFHGVQVRSVGRQILDAQARMLGDEVADNLGPVMATAVPDDDHVAAKVAKKKPQELGRSQAVIASIGNRLEAQVGLATFGRQREGGDRRDFLAVAAVLLEDGRLSARRQRSPHEGREHAAGLVDQHEVGVLVYPLLTIRGQSSRIQASILAWSRCLGCRLGFWGVTRRAASHSQM